MGRLSCLAVIAAWAMLACVTSCDQSPSNGPPETRPGQDACGECGMLIGDDRCAGALHVERGGQRAYILYDDIGCMLDAERTGLEGSVVLGRFVHDYQTRKWIPVAEAWFLMGDPKRVETPMGTGIAACSEHARADKLQESGGGRVVEWSSLVQARRVLMEERHGKPDK